MQISLKPERIKRYSELAKLLFEFGELGAHGGQGLTEELLRRDQPDDALDDEQKPLDFAKRLEELGPSFVKLGQMLSGRPDLLPTPYIAALSKLQDDVAPFPAEEALAIFEQQIGASVDKCFAEFQSVPLAAASLGQVHRARLHDGREVVVKIQRPGIRQQIIADLDAFADVAVSLEEHTQTGRRFGLVNMLAESRKTLLRELDYIQEANNLVLLKKNLQAYERIVVPEPFPDFSSSRVLTMSWVDGVKITALPAIVRTELDTAALAGELYCAYLDQVLVHGFFHADPHPGNILITKDYKLGVIDLGMAAALDPVVQEQLLRMLLKLSEGDGRDAAEVVIELSAATDEFDRENYLRNAADLVNNFASTPDARIHEGRIVLELVRIGGEHGLLPAPDLAVLGKTLLHLDEVGQSLCPGFDGTAALRKHAESIMRERSLKNLSPAKLFATAVEAQRFMEHLPGRLNKLLDALVEQRFSLKVDAFDEANLMVNLQKIANRIATGLVLAALIIGAALMMNIDAGPKLFGYPGIALVMFSLAALAGFWMVFTAFKDDRADRKQDIKKN